MKQELSSSEESVLSALRKLKQATCAEIRGTTSIGKNHVYHIIRALELGGFIEVIGIAPCRGSGRRSMIFKAVE
jgi:sugar-specific transcriptional regulator TrmB